MLWLTELYTYVFHVFLLVTSFDWQLCTSTVALNSMLDTKRANNLLTESIRASDQTKWRDEDNQTDETTVTQTHAASS